MKALVTGAEGFVGPYLIKELLDKDYEVVGSYHNELKEIIDNVDYKKLDVTNFDSVKETLKETQPDLIFHLAAISNVKLSFKKPKLTREVNVGGSKNIFDACFSLKNKPRILNISSAHVYGIPEEIPITEEHPLKPGSPYASTKLETEKLAKKYIENGLDIIIVRSFNHIGPGQSPSFVCSAFAKQIAEIEEGREPVMKVGNLKAKRDFTDVRDVVRAYVKAVKKAEPGEPYNICSGKSYSIQKILNLLLSLSESDIQVKKDQDRMRKSDIPILLGDYSKFNQITGWKPEISINKSLKDILNYWRKQ